MASVTSTAIANRRFGIREYRKKYVFIATSANFGNMLSMAGASLFLSFLPLLPTQILLINLLTDFPEMTIADANVILNLFKRRAAGTSVSSADS